MRNTNEEPRTPPPDFRVLAIISVRQDEVYLARCLRHAVGQGIDVCIVDNDANAATKEIVAAFRDAPVVHVAHHPHPGYFDWDGIVGTKIRLAGEIKADWYIFWDTDEIREAPAPFSDLRRGLFHADQSGYNSVNFDEFVFLPTDRSEEFLGRDYVAEMKHYYLFRPKPNNRLTAWKRTDEALDALSSGGHQILFRGQRVYPESFILRHYLFLSWDHALAKYCTRNYSEAELEKGWQQERARLRPENLALPSLDFMHEYRGDRVWRRDVPRHHHPCFPRPAGRVRAFLDRCTGFARRVVG